MSDENTQKLKCRLPLTTWTLVLYSSTADRSYSAMRHPPLYVCKPL